MGRFCGKIGISILIIEIFTAMTKKKTRKKRTTKQEQLERNGDGQDFISLNLSSGAKRTIFSVFFVVLALLFVLGFFEQAGGLVLF